MDLKSVSAVAVGRFNPAIIVPGWIRNESLVPDEGEWMSQAQLRGGGAMVLRHTAGAFSWQVTLDKLVVERTEVSPENAQSVASLVSAILERLPHTPISAVGTNLVFAVQVENAATLEPIYSQCAEIARLLKCELASTTQKLTLIDARGSQVNVEAAKSEDSAVLEVKFNFHRPVSSVNEARESLACFEEDLHEARTMVAAL